MARRAGSRATRRFQSLGPRARLQRIPEMRRQSHRAVKDGVAALVGVDVARDHNVDAVLVEEGLQVLLEVGAQLVRALAGVVGLVEADHQPPAQRGQGVNQWCVIEHWGPTKIAKRDQLAQLAGKL